MHCQKCGDKIIENANFCKGCGFAITNDNLLNQKLPTSALKRLANYFIDRILGAIVFCIFIVIIWGLISLLSNMGFISSENIVVKILNLIIPILISISFCVNPLYYLFFEGIWGRTLGKWITKTKVVRTDGEKPKFIQILGRSFARWIPFEAFSFLVSNNPVGWHDRLSGTLVVSAEYTIDDIKKINFEEVKNQKMSRGLLIVSIIAGSLVIIAMIGIFASIVLASLNSARSKGQDASIKANLLNLKVEAELYWDSQSVNGKNGSYYGLCSNDLSLVKAKFEIDNIICNDDYNGYAISAPLKSSGYFCVDNLSNTVNTDKPLNKETTCPLPNKTLSKEDEIKEAVEVIKSQTTLPSEIDSTTRFVDIVAEPSAIRYKYIIHDIDTSKISDVLLKNAIVPGVCKSVDLKNILNDGVDLQYFYSVQDSQQTYFTYVTKNDCSYN